MLTLELAVRLLFRFSFFERSELAFSQNSTILRDLGAWPNAGCSIASRSPRFQLPGDPIAQHRLLPGDLLKRNLAAFLV
jgi:hypothetical protein